MLTSLLIAKKYRVERPFHSHHQVFLRSVCSGRDSVELHCRARPGSGAATGPALLTYPELVQLYENEQPSRALQNKLTQLLNTPFVSNSDIKKGSQAPGERHSCG